MKKSDRFRRDAKSYSYAKDVMYYYFTVAELVDLDLDNQNNKLDYWRTIYKSIEKSYEEKKK